MIHVAFLPMPPMIFGCAEHDLDTGDYWVFISKNQCPLRQRQAFGHELAHIFLKHHDITMLLDRYEDKDSTAHKRYESCEAEANRRAWEYYRQYKDAFRQLQQAGKAKISICQI